MLELILTENVTKLGKAGELVRVKPGYGRNYLLPRGLALLATRDNMARLEHQRKQIEIEQAKIRAEHEKLGQEIAKTSVSIPRKVGEGDKIFGSVTTKDIADALTAQNIEIDRRNIGIPEPIKSTGTHKVEIRFSSDVKVELTVDVIKI